ncbi:hypothetical protein Skr01_36470 [Sphaerisporangium krabiense]|uniref:DNA primase/polymerase bifunctional N-terminal domain-containing protein n=1 Tax=Sphaerisporangium krabiense TaxID=763782 RepID=A0A7W8Z3A3_9ACTN|nr:bifunctional DNA primase/polymerase [Sphaerisporangium krabiense]MBB5626641.1 hypothetical protein [Sphaerisporangium krabiense]GII63562.1 hypothetical protein Skr01_36470 [Sphaerisporangium krabiense]
MTDLHIPEVDDDSDTLGAALAYARAGWYVLPVDQATKHAGSVLGKGWPSKSSRDAERIIAWFAGTDDALALHVGRSGAIVFDVDRPEALPSLMVAALGVVPGPFQSTRTTDERRGHYFYLAPPGRVLGNRLGGLGKGWGEVRGKNGIVVVAPSTHEKHEQGGRYHWVRTGSLPLLPQPVAAELPDAGDSADAATDGEVKAFLDRHTARERPELLHGVLTQVATALATGESRHGIALRATAGAMREAAAGLYPALEAATALLEAFTRAMATSRDGSERTLTRVQARGEFMGILAWAVAQVRAADLAAVRADVDTRLAPGDALAGLIAPSENRTAEPPPFAGDTFLPEVAKSQVDDEGDITSGDAEAIDLEALAFEREVAAELRRIRIREEAARRARKARGGVATRPPIVGLDDFLAVPDEPVAYRVQGLWPKGGRVVLAAQFKAGKTTMVGNLLRSLVDSTPFLGKFDVEPFAGKVVLLDDELDEGMVRRWLRDQRVQNTAAAAVVSLRGRLSSFDLLDPQTRSEWAADLRAAGATVVILDCLAPILDALGLSEDKEAGRFLVAFDEMLKEAGVQEAVLVHHMGHQGERSRGASRLRDWPDVEWRLVREKSDDGEMDPSAKRFFSAYGRDVDVPESLLSFDPAARCLEIAGGSRKDAKSDVVIDAISEWLTLSPGSSKRQIEDALGEDLGRNEVRKAIKRGVSLGLLRAADGARGSTLHWAVSGPSSAPLLTDHRRTDSVTSTFSAPPSSGEDHEPESSAPPVRQGGGALKPQVTGSVRHLATSAPPPIGGSAPVRPPKGGWRTGAHSASDTDPRDPSDLIAPVPDWILVDGARVNPATGLLLDPEDAL